MRLRRGRPAYDPVLQEEGENLGKRDFNIEQNERALMLDSATDPTPCRPGATPNFSPKLKRCLLLGKRRTRWSSDLFYVARIYVGRGHPTRRGIRAPTSGFLSLGIHEAWKAAIISDVVRMFFLRYERSAPPPETSVNYARFFNYPPSTVKRCLEDPLVLEVLQRIEAHLRLDYGMLTREERVLTVQADKAIHDSDYKPRPNTQAVIAKLQSMETQLQSLIDEVQCKLRGFGTILVQLQEEHEQILTAIKHE